MRVFAILFFVFVSFAIQAQDLQLALLKYRGGGDWYANPTSLPNLARFCNEQLGTAFSEQIATVEPADQAIFNYPFVHMTGHGNVIFDANEVQNLRNYLIAGGFLHIDDNYGMDSYIRPQMKKVFPELDFIELPTSHPIYNQTFKFPNGIPKIHVHDNKTAQAFGLIYEGRLVCLYTYETDLGDGWEDQRVHNDSEETRLKALRMGANIISYVFAPQQVDDL
ncbi:MAG: DUF4159 domain-containing protein [Bacteroidales bacterium]|jgi:hypothetical protein|nr:DUF4159 domain-containing protein [Bacteroidales bacterium]MDN5349370.1 hypothetical protein [Bacteroidales bacterium]